MSLTFSLFGHTALAEVDQAEIAFWNSVKDSKDPEELKFFLVSYPESQFAPLAKLRLKKLTKGAALKTSPTKKQPKSVVEQLEDRAKSGDVQAMYELGSGYNYAHKGFVKDFKKAAYWYEKAAANGDVWSQNNLGQFYYEGKGVKRNYVKARQLFRKGAEAGNSDAMRFLAAMYTRGHGGVKSVVEASKWIIKAARVGDYYAKVDAAKLYDQGKGAPRSHKKAAQYLFDAFAWFDVQKGDYRRNGFYLAQIDAILKTTKGFSRQSLRELQSLLAKAGAYDGKIDGILGRGMGRALKELGPALNKKAAAKPNEVPSKSIEDIGNIKDLETLD